jgi:non-ribosomal peptide synthetase component E (peptide arylation enzyme)
MKTRRTFITAAALTAVAAPLTRAASQTSGEDAKKADFLFVQTANGITFDKSTNKLTLDGVSPITVFFSDRPQRIAGNMKTATMVPFWSKGKNSFLSDAPNADVSMMEGDVLRQVVVVLRDPEVTADRLTYTVKVLQGDMPAKAADVSLFIDIIGMPLTPLSYAGVARRTYRRAYY